MYTPIAAAVIAAIRTAPAAMSLMFRILSFRSLVTSSQSFSAAVFRASRDNTKAEIDSMASHSLGVILN